VISLKDILKAINILIKSNFPAIDIQSMDISEGFKRPSFFVDADNYRSGSMMTLYKDRNLPIRIYYFPTSAKKNRIELIEVQEKLESIFLNSIKVNENFVIPINEVYADIVDGVLQFSFDLFTVEELINEDDTTGELIEELKMELS